MPGAGVHGPMVRPFFNHGGVIPIVRTALGEIGGGGLWDLTLGPRTLIGSDTLLVALSYDGIIAGAADSTTFNGVAMTLANGITGGTLGNDYLTQIYYLRMMGVGTTGNVVADFTVGAVAPTNSAMLVIGVSGLRQVAASNDRNKAARGGPSTTQASGLTLATQQAREFIWGIIATSGPYLFDVLGAWDLPLTAGNRTGFLALDLKEAYYTAAAINTFQARVTGATSQRYMALCSTFRGA
jgi:hypothetical protein